MAGLLESYPSQESPPASSAKGRRVRRGGRQSSGPTTTSVPPWPVGLRWKWIPLYGKLLGEIKYSAQADWSRYEERLTELIQFHIQYWVRCIFDLAETLYGIPPLLLAQWATNDQLLRDVPSNDPFLRAMLRDLRPAFEDKKQE